MFASLMTLAQRSVSTLKERLKFRRGVGDDIDAVGCEFVVM